MKLEVLNALTRLGVKEIELTEKGFKDLTGEITGILENMLNTLPIQTVKQGLTETKDNIESTTVYGIKLWYRKGVSSLIVN